MILVDLHQSHKEDDVLLKQAMTRFKIAVGLMLLFFSAIVLRLCDLGFTSSEEVDAAQMKSLHAQHVISRADILDRNGTLLASNVKTASIYAHPKQMINPKSAAKEIANLKIGINDKELLARLTSGKDFVWIKRHITPTEQQAVHDLGLPGVYFTSDERRIYPHENLFSHALGYVNIDGAGIAGFEKLYDSELRDLNKSSRTIYSSFDLRVQNILHNEIKTAIETHSAAGGAGVVMNVKTGEVIAMCSLPDFNPHTLNNNRPEQLFNQNTLGVYEWGSIFKVFTMAMGLDTNKISVNDVYDVSKPLKVGRFQINDYKSKGGLLSVPEVFMYSSNIGTAKIAQAIGAKEQRDYLQRFGLLSQIKGFIPEMVKPTYPNERNWSEASLITISYGHGIAVTAMHVSQAISAVVNGGLLYKPTMLKLESLQNVEFKRVIKEKTSHDMRKLMRLAAVGGYAKNANVEGLVVGGKTGTAEKNQNGRYLNKLNMATFVGAFPMHSPEYVVLIMIDEAKPNNINFGYTTGGMIAAPVGGKVIQRMAKVLNIQHYQNEDNRILQALHLEYTPRRVTTIAKR